MRHVFGVVFVSTLGLTPLTAAADSMSVSGGATHIIQPQGDLPWDGTPYWIVPHVVNLSCARNVYPIVSIYASAVNERAQGDTIDSLSFNGTVSVQWRDGHWATAPISSLSFEAPGPLEGWFIDCAHPPAPHTTSWEWIFLAVSGSGSFRPCDYIDPGNKRGGRRCYPTVQYSVNTTDWHLSYWDFR